MVQAVIDLSLPDRQKTRTELTLTALARAWSSQPRGQAFAQALLDFLTGQTSPSTIRAYSYSILQLFEWIKAEQQRLPTPGEVSRADAASYDRWLRGRTLPLTRERLGEDPRRRMDAAIWDIVAASPGCNSDQIRTELAQRPEYVTTAYDASGQLVRVLKIDQQYAVQGGLDRHLACLVLDHTLTRTPTIEQLRREGMPVGAQPSPGIFRYYVPEVQTPAGAERSSGIVTRLTALSSFWAYLTSNGENIAGRSEPLLRYNIWTDTLRKARSQAPSNQAAGRAQKTPELELFIRLLETTFVRSHGAGARAAAEAATFSRPVPAPPREPAYADLRDQALLLMMLQPGGPRASELQRMRRGHLDSSSDPPVLTIVGKRGKKRLVPVPPGALAALQALDQKLRRLARHQLRYRGTSRAARLLEPTAPLLPVIAYWGRNAGLPSTRGLSRAGIAMALRRRAESAGIEPGTAAFKKVHPHGFRHLFAKTAIESGTKLNVVQAMMGHASGATTLRYMEERRPEVLIAEAFRGVPEQEPVSEPVLEPVPEPFRAPTVQLPAEPAVVEVVREPALPPAVREKPPRAATTLAALPPRAPEAATPPAKRLVAVGAPPGRPVSAAWEKRLKRPLTPEESRELSDCARRDSEAERKLCEIYTVDWGERVGGRTRPFQGTGATWQQEEDWGPSSEEESAPKIAVRRQANLLGHTYAGKQSGLLWWGGVSGKLKPEMTVASAEQIGTCSPDEQSELCGRLTELWLQWSGADTTAEGGVQPELRPRGPTSACALVGWVDEAIEVSAQVEEVIVRAGDRWVEPDAPWSETKLGGSKDEPVERTAFREHSVDRIMEWFEDVAWQYRTSRGRVSGGKLVESAREPKVIGSLPKVPDWYGEVDPIGTLPRAERMELLDFLTTMTGGVALQDRTPRFQRGATRRDLSGAIELMRRYEEQLKNIRDAKNVTKSDRPEEQGTNVLVRRSEEAAERAAAEANAYMSALGVAGFDIAKLAKERTRGRKAPGQEETREYLGNFYLRVLADAFGPEVADDRLLRMVARNKYGPLAAYRELLAPDNVRGTIVHRPRYADEFARATGAHSECVARRIGRDLYEFWNGIDKPYIGSKAFPKRADELGDLIDAMAAYRVPCPAAQELELRARLGPQAAPVAIFERWSEARRVREMALPAELREQELLEEVFDPFQEEYALERAEEAMRAGRLQFTENPQAKSLRYDARVARALPNPIELRWAVRAAR